MRTRRVVKKTKKGLSDRRRQSERELETNGETNEN